MKLLSRNAELLLTERVNLIAKNHDSWRCIYVKSYSAAGMDQQVKTGIITGIIKSLLGGDEGYIYLCSDGDLFILFQGQTTPILNRIGGHFADLNLGSDSAYHKDEQYTVFDLSKHWESFYKLCSSKLVVTNPETRAVEIVKPLENKMLPEIDRNLFAAALKKRNHRQRLVVMLVEDDPFTRRLISGVLKQDYDIIEAGSGLAAQKAYELNAPDAVFLDIELPDVNGHQLLNKFLSLDKAAFIVMLSANSMKENILIALEKGAQGFVAKPFVREKLIHYLRTCESLRRQKELHAGV